MENNKITLIGGRVIICYAAAMAAVLTAYGVRTTIKALKKLNDKRKIKKGLKNGSIIEIDGEYYEVSIH